MPLLPEGSEAPPFALTAAVSERPVNLQISADKLLLIFHTYHTAVLVGSIVKTVRETYPDPEQLFIASVTDLRSIPRLLHGVARKIIRDAYHQAAQEVPEGEDPADHIIILPDWKGKAFTAYQVPESNNQVSLVLIDRARLIQGTYLGDDPLPEALALLNGRN